jgi:hypothetical protein
MNQPQKIYFSLAVVSLVVIFFLPIAVLSPAIRQYLSEPSNPSLSLFYLAEGFVFFALAFLALGLMQFASRRSASVKKPIPPIIIFFAGLGVIYAGYAKLLCDLNETNFFVYAAGVMLIFLAIFPKTS